MKNQEDITVLFETYHAFSDIDKIKQTLEKYVIDDENEIEIVYSTDFTLYHELVEQIKQKFPDRESIKGTTYWILNNLCMGLLYSVSFYFAYLSSIGFFMKCIAQIIYGFSEGSLMFNLLHDGSHYGISIYPKTNEIISKIANAMVLWNSNSWLEHHVYKHHSITGLETDPDNKLYSYKTNIFFIYIKNIPVINNIFDYFSNVSKTNIFYMLLPGQLIGQSLVYLHNNLTNDYYDYIDFGLMSLKLYTLYSSGWIQTGIYIFIANTLYYINVYPNHSSYETKIENHYEGNDWAKLQICNSGNFVMSNLWWTRLFGGINYQIEHHLFPNMSNIHYPEISVIVKKFCKDRSIPYVNHDTFLEAWNSFSKYINYGSNKKND